MFYPRGAPVFNARRILRFEGVWHSYDNSTWALRELDLDIEAGACVAVSGSNGSGKSTLACLAMGERSPTHGQVFWGDAPASELDRVQRSEILYFNGSRPTLSEVIAMRLRTNDLQTLFDFMADAYMRVVPDPFAAEVLRDHARVGFCTASGILDRRQVGRSDGLAVLTDLLLRLPLAVFGQLLIFDEVTAHLDGSNQARFYRLIDEVCKIQQATNCFAHKPTRLFFTPKPRNVLRTKPERIILLNDGEIVFDKSSADVEYLRVLRTLHDHRLESFLRQPGALPFECDVIDNDRCWLVYDERKVTGEAFFDAGGAALTRDNLTHEELEFGDDSILKTFGHADTVMRVLLDNASRGVTDD